MIKIKKSFLTKLIKEVLLVEFPQLDKYGGGANFDMGKIKNKIKNTRIKEGEAVLKYPGQRDIDHESMRIKTLYAAGYPTQYMNRIGKITNPQKLYNMYLACLEWKKIHRNDTKDMEKYAKIAREKLREYGYEHLPVGRGNQIRVDVN